MISSPGGNLLAFDGNVTFPFPEGALDYAASFKINLCQDAAHCSNLLKTISIEPHFLVFNKPVGLSFRYDVCLMNDPVICCPDVCVSAFRWNSIQDFLEQWPGQCCNCILNNNKNTVDLVIYQTGIFTIGRKN